MNLKKAFTLIELLVVIAIIALLMGILMPALSAVREQAKKVVCQSNMKQMGAMIIMYALDNDDALISKLAGAFPSGQNLNIGGKSITPEERGAAYYTYRHTGHPANEQGPGGIGWLYKANLLESDSKLPFCPTNGKRLDENHPNMKDWIPKGQTNHWNYCGVNNVSPATGLNPRDFDIKWLPLRLSVGIRGLNVHTTGVPGGGFTASSIRKVSDAVHRRKRAFMSDFWAAQIDTGAAGYWATSDKDIPHTTGGRMSMNVWYLDGSSQNVHIKDEWFEFKDGENRLKKTSTWSLMFD